MSLTETNLARMARAKPGMRLGRWRASLPALLLAVVVLALPPLWASLVAAPQLRVDVGVWGDHAFLSGVNGPEQSASETYRWTDGRALLALPNLGGQYRALELHAHGWRPDGAAAPELRLAVAGRPFGAFQTAPELRVYRILLPPTRSPELRVGLESAVYQPPGDSRQVGVALDWVALGRIGQARPSAWQLLGQAGLLALLALLVAGLGLPGGPAALLTAALCAALYAANLRQPLWVSAALPHWLACAALLLAANWLLRPRLTRALAPWMSPAQARWAWGLLAAALALRLFGSVHPLFNAHDIDVHTRWISIVDGGQLYLYSTPGELRNRPTFNPPAGYLLMLPFWLLLPSPRLVVQAGVALADALGCLLLLPLARELRLGPRAALLGLALYLALPINTTMLWWGFATNALAQACWLLLCWLLLRLVRRPDGAALALFVVAGAVTVTMHAGALVLVAALLGLCALLGWLVLPRRGWLALLVGLALVGLVVLPLYFSGAAGPVLEQSRDPDNALGLADSLAKGWRDRELRLALVRRGVELGLTPALPWLAAPGLLLAWLARDRHPLGRVLLCGWLAVCGLFVLVYLGLGLTTRYIYFAAPALCLLAGTSLARLWPRPGGRTAALALTLLVVCSGASLWLAGVLLRVKPSVVPLTH